jgi:Flp pilus assembly protein TadD
MFLRQIGAAGLFFSVAACAGSPGQAYLGSNQDTGIAKSQVASYLLAADSSRAASRFSEAVQIYEQVLITDPKSVAAQFGIAECLLGLGKAADARPLFEALVQDKTVHATALQGKGLSHLAMNERESAGNSLHEAIEADPSLWRAWNGLGLLADLKREWHEAEDAYGHALAINANSAALHNNLGYSRLLAGQPDEAIGEFRKALGLDPDSETVQNNFRLALAAKGNYAEATRGVSKAMMPVALNNVGVIAMQRGDFRVAEGFLARAMESSPSFLTVASHNIDQLKAMENDGGIIDTTVQNRAVSATKLATPGAVQ